MIANSQLRKGDPVVVVEGLHAGLIGKIANIYKAWREGQQLKLVSIDPGGGNPIEVRQSFVRADRPMPGIPPGSHTTTESPEGAARRAEVAEAAPPAATDRHLLEVLGRHLPVAHVESDFLDSSACVTMSCSCGQMELAERWVDHIKRVEKLH